jgi:hypothetical protein
MNEQKIWKAIIFISLIAVLVTATILFINFFKYREILDANPVPQALHTLWPEDYVECRCMHKLTNGGTENWWFNQTASQRTKRYVGFN